MNSQLHLFGRQCGIDRTKNPIFDGFTNPEGLLEWLIAESGYDRYYIQDFQYQKINSMDWMMKINMEQSIRVAHDIVFSYGCIIQDGFYFFFYVNSTKWVSQNTIGIDATMDTLNTFYHQYKNSFGGRTHTTRRHKPRFKENSVIAYDQRILERIVDPTSEGIFPELYLHEEDKILDRFNGKKWYLIYQTRDKLTTTDITNPIECGLVASEEIALADTSYAAQKIIRPSNLETYVTYFVLLSENSDPLTAEIVLSDQIFTHTLNSENGDIAFAWRVLDDDPNVAWLLRVKDDGTTEYLRNFERLVFHEAVKIVHTSEPNATAEKTESEIKSMPYFYLNSLTEYAYLMPISGIDRTSPKLMKIIELPYAPSNGLQLSNGRLAFDNTEWTYEKGTLKHNYIQQAKFSNDDFALKTIAETYAIPTAQITTSKTRFLKDPKLFHKDYYLCNFVYDSFIYNIPLENIISTSSGESNDVKIKISFKASNAITSRFAFKFETIEQAYTKMQTENFGEYLLVSRNNEMPIFSNNYVDYIRTGYNYDIKQKQNASASNALAIGVATASTVASIAGTIASGGSLAPALAASAVSMASVIGKVAISEKQANESIDQKLKTISNQKSSVAGADDLDLLNYYSDNALWLKTYRPRQKIMDMLDDLFYFFGYTTNEYGVPDLHTRVWFDYIVCEPDFFQNVTMVWQDYQSDISERFKEGVTIFHRVGSDMDLNQKKENWERFLIE